MRFEHEGRTLWFGTEDAPATEVVQASQEAVITIGVSPVDPSNRVELLYRVNQGAIRKIAAAWVRNDHKAGAQYFRVRLPGFAAGDVVEYIPICVCAGRQVPSQKDAKTLVSFTVGKTIDVSSKKSPVETVVSASTPNGAFAAAEFSGILVPTFPSLSDAQRRQMTLDYALVAGIDDKTANQLLETNLTFDRLTPTTLSDLESGGVLTSTQRTNLQLSLELGRLTGDNLPLVTSIRNREITSTIDLVSWTKTQWQQVITTDKIALPAGETLDSFTDNVLTNLDQAYPSQTLFTRLLTGWQDKLSLLDSPTGQTELMAFANTFRHLGTLELINDKDADPSKTKSTIGARLQLLDTFFQNNKELDLRRVDFFKSTEKIINWSNISIGDRPMVRRQLMAYQRVLNLADSTADRETLLGKGYDSAITIAAKTEGEFIVTSGLERNQARVTYGLSRDSALAVCLECGVIQDVTRGGFTNIAVNNVPARLINDLREIDGFDDLFGPQDFCDCEDCKSIFGPAAYFVDLMSFVERHVLNPVFVNLLPTAISPDDNRTDSSLYLKNRRPDLWALQLTCENTHAQVPYLTIVNEVLESYLRTAFPAGDLFTNLNNNDERISVRLPFNLPLAELRLYLGHFGITLHDIYRTLRVDQSKIWRERLKLSAEEFNVIKTDQSATVKGRFGNPATLNDFHVNEQTNGAPGVSRGFINYAGITRQQLDELLTQLFNTDLAQIVVDKQSIPDELQNFPEILKNLTNERLDFIHRFIRLWRKTSWSLPDFDLVLMTMREAGLLRIDFAAGNIANFEPLAYLARLVDIQEKLKLSVEEVCAFIDEFPDVVRVPPALFAALPVSREFPKPPPREADRRLYERLFDLKKLFGESNAVTHELNTSVTFRHYSFNTNNPNDQTIDPNTPVLLGGLGVSETELLLLFDLLRAEMPFLPNGETTLDRKRISLLYRHARLARALKLSIDDFIQSLHLNFAANNRVVTKLDQVQRLIEFRDWLKLSPFTVSDLRFILKGEETSAVKFKSNRETATRIVLEVRNSQVADRTDALKIALSSSFNLSAHQLDDSLQWVATGINSAAVANALDAPFTDDIPDDPADLDPLVTLLRELERIVKLFESLKFKEENVAYLTRRPQTLSINNPRVLTLENLKALTSYKRLISLGDEAAPIVEALLDHYLAPAALPPNDLLADLFQQDRSLIDSLTDSLTLPAVPIEAIDHLWEVLRICQTLGINGYSLEKLADNTNFAAIVSARDVALGAFSSKYDDEKVRKEKLEPYLDQINVIKRDVLCDYIIARERVLNFKDTGDIYAFFLLDVEMSGCFRTSRVAAAISSLQLYVHRILMNLEQSSAGDIVVLGQALAADVMKQEWEWRKNYRVWEANRKVFVYPENYIEPDLRNNKTHLFKELEDELLQEKITEQSAEDAYRKYLAGFTDLAKLKIAGSYYAKTEPDEGKGTYYIFGRTSAQPYQYYYRTYQRLDEQNVWGNWTRMELALDASEVSALIHLGRLYVFWTHVERREISFIEQSNSRSGGYVFKVFTRYSSLNERGQWSPPQKVFVGYVAVTDEMVQNRVWTRAGQPLESDRPNLVERFQEEVFRKPYPVLTGEPSAPVRLHYLWTIDKLAQTAAVEITTQQFTAALHEEQVTYTLGWSQESEPERIQPGERPIFVCAPETETGLASLGPYTIDVQNGAFPVRKRVRWRLDGVTQASQGELVLRSPSQCEVKILLPEPFVDQGCSSSRRYERSEEDIALQVTAANSVPGTPYSPKRSQHDLSLATNTVRDAGLINFLTVAPDSVWHKEYTVAYGVADPAGGYVLNGTDTFANTGKIVNHLHDDHSELVIPGLPAPVVLTTILIDEFNEKIFVDGLESFLSLDVQRRQDNNLQSPDFNGPYGTYYWELFFHIPFLIAHHLNANQKFREAKWWYERIFDPATSEPPVVPVATDRMWRFREFRNLSVEKLRELLIDSDAIGLYKQDPFNPHAIARLRPSAYQKSIVMKFVDNLLDWGDFLFAQDTAESINEATMLYVLASDILGKRPAKQGKCSSAPEGRLSYDFLSKCPDEQQSAEECSEFLVYLENWNLIGRTAFAPANGQGFFSSPFLEGARFSFVVGRVGTINPSSRWPNFDLTIQRTLAFCVPPNFDLLKYWDRVEDRLFKIRHCMNISGVRRQLALFQPAIDPMVLVRARAAGLSLEDVLAMLAAPLPRYRFNYLIERAKQFAQTVQSFGGNLLSALEKKDSEELVLLRSLHERNILNMTKEIKKQQLKEAQYQHRAMIETLTNVQNRIDYYKDLVEASLTDWEVTQQTAMHTSTIFKGLEGVNRILAAIFYLIPQLGSPFALKFGGKETGDSANAWSEWFSGMSSVASSISSSASMEAGFQRREQEWKQQLLLAQQEFKQVDQQRLAAEVRQLIAEKDLENHEKNIEQADELHESYKTKFTNLGLYNYLATTLTRLYREAYNVAFDIAKMAERAYQFERGDDTATFIAGDNWQFDRAGLLAGERLLLQLQRLEKAFLEQHTRDYEVNQSFSLALLNPSALVSLRQTGTCEFTIPEVWFDLSYPGQYRRVIKSVRLSVPCVTGPYNNVSGKLTLKSYKVRNTAATGPLDLIVANPSTSIATSNAQNDGGLFELNFRDERYLPFEGAGAVDSTWELELPSTIRLFDYDSISDVIVHISYTARDGGSFKDTVENEIVVALTQLATTSGMSRLVSLKHEFPNAFHRLLNPPGAGQPAAFDLTDRHLPYFLTKLLADPNTNHNLSIVDDEVVVYLQPKGEDRIDTNGLTLRVNNTDVGNWTDFGRNLRAGIVDVSGTPIRQWTIADGNLPREEIDDVLILLKYRIN